MARRAASTLAETRRRQACLAAVPLWAIAGLPAPAAAQEPRLPAERSTLAVAAFDAASALQDVAPMAPAAIWPGFRPDTLAVVLTLPEVGWLLTGWPGPPPEGFRRLEGMPGLAWRAYRTGVPEPDNTLRIEGRRWISYRASEDRARDLGNLAHEAFHLFQDALRSEERYPPGENSFRVVSYPEFDAANEAALGLEGRLLDGALRALPDTAEASALAREFVAVREARQRRMDPADAAFEIHTELNEGVAQYVYVRALQLAAAAEPDAWAADARSEVEAQRALLADLLGERERSARLRFYATGLAQGLLLDALAGPSWKERVMVDGASLQDLVAEASGYRAAEHAHVARARQRHPDLEAAGRAAVDALARDREGRVADALAGPGIRIDIDASALPGGDVGFCGIDPQNLLQAGPDRLLHARWFRACGPGFQADMHARVVHDRGAGSLALVVPAEGLRVSVDGTPLEAPSAGASVARSGAATIDADGVSIRAERATVTMREGRIGLVVEPTG